MTASFTAPPQPVSSQTSRNATPVTIRCKGVLFDMDGILISSLGSVERSWRAWAVSHSLDVAKTIHTAHGRRAIETIQLLCPDLDSEAELKHIEDLEVADNDGLAVLPGVLDLLAALPTASWTVVTSATERLARVRLAAGGVPVPEKIITADHVTSGKPHPAPYLAGAALLGMDPKDCVVFEDSASGTKSGRAAGCIVIGTTFSHPVEELSAAHYLIEDLTGISVHATPGQDSFELTFAPLAIQK
ncbi:HAD-IA family hydrolase [Acidicapsa dinghuensis]|uniref:HAD-IA family hydrolase n=1 Tax=Acidicapsa dinghuensis TaxID=2218256 RepID=A0ABW1EC26_9BACT|nr:HAD-IA family hydrolase [Acidicapsa dinghuensis]